MRATIMLAALLLAGAAAAQPVTDWRHVSTNPAGDAMDISEAAIIVDGTVRTTQVRLRKTDQSMHQIWLSVDCATPRFRHVEQVDTSIPGRPRVVPLGDWTVTTAPEGVAVVQAVCAVRK